MYFGIDSAIFLGLSYRGRQNLAGRGGKGPVGWGVPRITGGITRRN